METSSVGGMRTSWTFIFVNSETSKGAPDCKKGWLSATIGCHRYRRPSCCLVSAAFRMLSIPRDHAMSGRSDTGRTEHPVVLHDPTDFHRHAGEPGLHGPHEVNEAKPRHQAEFVPIGEPDDLGRACPSARAYFADVLKWPGSRLEEPSPQQLVLSDFDFVDVTPKEVPSEHDDKGSQATRCAEHPRRSEGGGSQGRDPEKI